MINEILSKLGLGDGSLNADIDTRRKYIRHTGLQAEVQVADKAFSLLDWSMGGICFDTQPDARIMEGDKVNVTVRFRFPHETISISQKVKVVRSQKRGVAATFEGVTPDVRKQLEKVLDSYHAQSFLESQVA